MELERESAPRGAYKRRELKERQPTVFAISKEAEELLEEMKELCITQKEIADSIGVDERTISGFINGKDTHEDTKKGIYKYIKEKSNIGKFRHIPSKDFSKLLKTLIKEFHVTREELANEIGKLPKNITYYTSGAEMADTKTQRDILEFFHEKSINAYFDKIKDVSIGTDKCIRSLLYHETDELSDNEFEYCLSIVGRLGKYSKLNGVTEKWFSELPIKVQNIIRYNFEAFYDNADCRYDIYYSFDFEKLKKKLIDFQNMPGNQREEYVDNLEKNSLLTYPWEYNERSFFRHITSYRNMIYLTKDKPLGEMCIEKPSAVAKPYHKAFTQGHIQKLYTDIIIADFHPIPSRAGIDDFGEYFAEYDDEDEKRQFEDFFSKIDHKLLDEMQFKMTFTSCDWYIWMLLLISDYKIQIEDYKIQFEDY